MAPLVSLPFQCLPDPNNYHEFCRLLARLKSNYQLGELVKVENYPEVIRLIANFTVTSLQVGAGSQAEGRLVWGFPGLHARAERWVPHHHSGSRRVGFLCFSTGSLPPTVFTTC